MSTRAVFITSSLILAVSATSALAADIYAPSAGGLKDPIIKEQVIMPDVSTFREYAEWYIRGEIGIGRYGDMSGSGDAEGTDFTVGGLDFDNIYSAGAGFGRYITPNVRLGLDVDYHRNSSSNFSTGNPASVPELTNLGSIPLELSTTTVMFNAVYDFAPKRRFSPYVGGGIGWAFHTLDFDGSTFTNDIGGPGQTGTVTVDSTRSSHFAANVVTGVSINLRQGLFLDVGYKFSYLGDADVDFDYTHTGPLPDPDPTIELNDIMTHEFRVGLRYDLY